MISREKRAQATGTFVECTVILITHRESALSNDVRKVSLSEKAHSRLAKPEVYAMRPFVFAGVPLGVALIFLVEAVRVYSSKKPDRPMLIALALYIIGIAFAANVLYVWRTTLSIRISVVLMLV